MSLATTCTACGTVFRVVQDQLKISEGWVRCGRCDEVFNALEGLFDLDRDTAPGSLAGELDERVASSKTTPVAAWPKEPVATPRAAAGARASAAATPREETSLVDRLDSELFPERHGGAVAPSSRFTSIDSTGFGDYRADTGLQTDDESLSRPIESGLPYEDSAPLPQDTASGAPEFLRRADRAARWNRPGVRVLLSLALLVLLAALTLQTAHHWRHGIAARWPDTLPWFAQWCELASCSIDPPRRIDDIGLESSGFTRIAGVDQFRLSVVLRNRSTTLLAMPWIELTLTDAGGALLVRKALSPQDFRVPKPVLAAEGEANLQLLLAAGTPLVTGYTVEIFYP